MGKKAKSNKENEIRGILKELNPDLKRLLEITQDPGEVESVLFESIRSGARNLRMARRMLKKS